MAKPTTSLPIGKRDFTRKVNEALRAQGYEIVSIVASKLDADDIYMCNTAYVLIDTRADAQFIRSFMQVKALASGSRKTEIVPMWRWADLGISA